MSGRARPCLSLVLALTLTAAATAQPVGGPGGGGPIEQQTRWRLLTSAAAAADLKVSDAQKAKLKAIPDAVRAKHQAEAAGDTAKYQRLAAAKYEELSREALARSLLLLGAEQRTAWEALTGPAVKLPALDTPLQPSPLLNVRLLLIDEPPGPAFDDPAD